MVGAVEVASGKLSEVAMVSAAFVSVLALASTGGFSAFADPLPAAGGVDEASWTPSFSAVPFATTPDVVLVRS